jgi:DNA ligase (NAD+)
MSEALLQGAFSANVIRGMIDYLNARTAEYDAGVPTISDKEWDDSYFELKRIEEATGIIFPDSPTQSISYTVVNQLNKVTHNHAMLSLAKTKEVEEVENFVGFNEYICMAKMDGLTCSLKYVDGELVSAETRGNGIVGEDVTHNAMVIASIPKHIPASGVLVCDGEIISTERNFERFASEYKNERNFASGSIRLLDASECQKRGLTFVLWDVIEGLEDKPTLRDKLNSLMNVGFEVVPWTAEGTIEQQIEFIKQRAAEKGYPIDGAVFKFDNVAYGKSLGRTAHHFKNAIAFKFYDEISFSNLIDIEWTMGRTGVLTPVAVFAPIEMDGSTVERASLHNVSIMKELLKQPFVGQEVGVFKANMIIPQIGIANEPAEGQEVHFLQLPKVCPICGENVELVENDGVQFLRCSNPSCEGKLINRLDHFCGKKGLDIKGLSKATLEKLIDWGWVNGLVDIFKLAEHKADWVSKPGFGEKSVSNILNAIEASKDVTLDKFISSLGIPLIGTSVAKEMAKHEYGWFQIREDIEGNFDFTKWNGFGDAMSTALKRFDYREADFLWDNYLHITNPLWIDPDAKPEETQKTSLNGKTIVITGKLTTFKNRAELVAAIEQAGGKVASAVSGKTDILINNDNTSSSAKNVAAQKNGIPILTEEAFIQEFL